MRRRASQHQQQHLALWVCCLCLFQHTLVTAAPRYQPRLWNRSCNHTVRGIPAAVFFILGSSDGGRPDSEPDSQVSSGAGGSSSSSLHADRRLIEPLFPFSPGYRASHSAAADGNGDATPPVVAACFGPGEPLNDTLVAAGVKMPCSYALRQQQQQQPGEQQQAQDRGSSLVVDYWEEGVCLPIVNANCYAYALDRRASRGYNLPGWRRAQQGNSSSSSAPRSLSTAVELDSCADAAAKVTADGGVAVDRAAVAAGPPADGHHIALAVHPGMDFHFFRQDEGGTWSHKRGDTLVTNTYPNGSVITDVEDASILGGYQLCGYWRVQPATHADTDSGFSYSSLPLRLAEAASRGLEVSSDPLPQPTAGWARLNYPYLLNGLDAAVFEAAGRQMPWENQPSFAALVANGGANEAGAAQRRPSPAHWMSRAQDDVPVEERDAATQRFYAAAARRQLGGAP